MNKVRKALVIGAATLSFFSLADRYALPPETLVTYQQDQVGGILFGRKGFELSTNNFVVRLEALKGGLTVLKRPYVKNGVLTGDVKLGWIVPTFYVGKVEMRLNGILLEDGGNMLRLGVIDSPLDIKMLDALEQLYNENNKEWRKKGRFYYKREGNYLYMAFSPDESGFNMMVYDSWEKKLFIVNAKHPLNQGSHLEVNGLVKVKNSGETLVEATVKDNKVSLIVFPPQDDQLLRVKGPVKMEITF